ncbi:hypothetical protein CEXT_470191 [Caerostris extrusa]|uniref:Uncharacterized protein n=1 Tax=Caerostris extrusa TaxID=172846 RepID=A0AAV4WK15_CAEEX|nr:hypothetical protein CEXT_470191 [Caerostris extrusa]
MGLHLPRGEPSGAEGLQAVRELPLLRGRVPEDLLQPVLPVRALRRAPLRHRLLLRQGAQSHLREIQDREE